jgi:DNA-binding transcriptional LysR family regulator
VGAFRTFAPLILPDLCVNFADLHPKVAIEMFEDDEAELVAKVRSAELDIALTYEQRDIDLKFEQLALLPTYVLMPARHGLARSGSLKLKDLAEQPFVLLDLPVSREYFLSLFTKVGITPRIVARSAQPETVRSLVASGLGFSLLTARPKSLTALNGGELAYLYLDDDFPPMKLGMVTAGNIRKTRAVEAFEEHCRKSVSTHSIPGMMNW